MNYTIENNQLIITADNNDIMELNLDKQTNENFDSDEYMYDMLEPMVCNSELEWISQEETGDLTDAPMLGIRNFNHNIIHRWAFMDYQIISIQQRLLDCGQAVFIS